MVEIAPKVGCQRRLIEIYELNVGFFRYRLSVTVKLNDGIEPGIGYFYTKVYILGINEIPGNLSNYLFLLFN